VTSAWAPILIVVATWWLSTGLVLGLVWRGRAGRRGTMVFASVMACVGVAGVVFSRAEDSTRGVYLGFASALAIWAWHELAFLLGVVTGPVRQACPADARGWRRFGLATGAVIHHELALALTLLSVVALTWGHTNQVATATFAVLWAMRLSTKLNIFFGVRNLTEEFIPQHLQYLRSFFRSGANSPLLPASLLAGVVVTGAVLSQALGSEVSEAGRLGSLVVGALLALGVLEHVFLAVPLREAALWRWIMAQPTPGPP
jgi:putative photosynthetic complex assembly protein 2